MVENLHLEQSSLVDNNNHPQQVKLSQRSSTLANQSFSRFYIPSSQHVQNHASVLCKKLNTGLQQCCDALRFPLIFISIEVFCNNFWDHAGCFRVTFSRFVTSCLAASSTLSSNRCNGSPFISPSQPSSSFLKFSSVLHHKKQSFSLLSTRIMLNTIAALFATAPYTLYQDAYAQSRVRKLLLLVSETLVSRVAQFVLFW